MEVLQILDEITCIWNEMNIPIGESNELPIHYKQGSNGKAVIKYETMMVISVFADV